MTYTYIINVVAPISVISERQISYNKYPIVCISKKGLDKVWENQQVQDFVESTINNMGNELIDKSVVHVRIVDSKARITDEEIPTKNIVELWR